MKAVPGPLTFDIAEAAKQVLESLESSGYEAWLVGGCVRDLLMGQTPKDWDIATDATPEQVTKVFRDRSLIETGLKHGTVTVVTDHFPIEITTFREDGVYSDQRRPDTVCFTKSLLADLARRDFTINALAYHPVRGVIDCFDGMQDLSAKQLRCVGDPTQRFSEDALRILRGLRFAATLSFQIEEETAAAIHRERERLQAISAERITAEMNALLMAEQVKPVLLEFADVIGVFIPEILPMIGFQQHNDHHVYDVWEHSVVAVDHCPYDLIVRWAALLHDIGKPACFSLDEDGVGHFYGHSAESERLADKILRRLKFPNAQLQEIKTLVGCHDLPLKDQRRTARRYLARFGETVLKRLIALKRADNFALAPAYLSRQSDYDRFAELVENLLEEGACCSLADLQIKGGDLLRLGFQGAEIGQTLQRLLERVIDETLPNEEEELQKTALELQPCRDIAKLLEQAKFAVVLSGAGMDTESGLKDFRSQDGWWRQYNPAELASIDTFAHNYPLFHEFYSMRLGLMAEAKPHSGHYILADWEKRGYLQTIVTQNVSGLHRAAGSREVLEIHGTLAQTHCQSCGRSQSIANFISNGNCDCGGLLRPDVVLFGENLPEDVWQSAIEAIRQSDLLIVLGTSLTVYPAAGLIDLCSGKRVLIDLGAEADARFDFVLKEKAGQVLAEINAYLPANANSITAIIE